MTFLNSEFLQTIQQAIPNHLSLDDFITFSQRPLRRSIRVNTLKISCDKFVELANSRGWQLTPIPWCESGFWVESHNDEQLGNSIWHLAGLFYIQEASSMLPPMALFSDNEKFHKILDLAAAPGSKTTQISALMNNQGLLIANEYSSSRLKSLHANLVRMGVTNTALTHFDGKVFGEYLYETFDAVLLDAPCSGEGTIRKDHNALKHWQLSDIKNIAAKQQELIESAFLALKPNGKLIYSTCTLNHYENTDVCYSLKEKFGDAVRFLSLANLFPEAEKATTNNGFLHVWPQIYDSEGFFIAAIEKTASVSRQKPVPNNQKNFPFSLANEKQHNEIKAFAKELNLSLPDNHQLMIRDNEYWLFPNEFMPLIERMRFQRIGIKLADKSKHGLKICYEAVLALTSPDTTLIELNTEQAIAYLKGQDIPISLDKNKTIATACFQGVSLGRVKIMPNKLKNQLPRDRVQDSVYY